MESLRSKAEQGAIILGGVVFMLLVAGLLEGFGRQLITNDWVRYGIGTGMFVFWMLYFFAPRRQDETL
jgi:hypothetical protein